MTHVLVLKAANPAGESSPEMRYLLSDLLLQVRRAFGAATLLVVGAEEGAGGSDGAAATLVGHLESDDFSHALLLGPGDVLLRVPSLRRMAAVCETAAAHEGGADGEATAAVARRLAVTDLAAGVEVYTLSDFERLEERYLAPGSGPAAPPRAGTTLGDLRPATLVTAAGLRALLAAHPPEALVGGPGTDDGAPMPDGVTAVSAGLCHEFIDYYGEVRADVAPFLPEGAREVVEVGCGRGATGRYLQDELGCRVTGVELNPVVGGEAAGHLHRVVIGNVEEPATVAELEAGLESGAGFDALLALELFEHLVEPERFLARVRPLVRPGGRIILSVPNVGHHSVVRDLMAGRWDYLPIGILCYTHYRFYTRRTLADWLARCGFPDAKLVAQRTPPPDWLPVTGGEAGDGGSAGLGLPLDAESLTTKGFYALLDV